MQYRFYFDGGWTTWVNKMTQEVSYSTAGEKEILVMTRDERRKESEEITININVKANSQPIAIKTALDPSSLLNPGKVYPILRKCAEQGRIHVHGTKEKFSDIPRF